MAEQTSVETVGPVDEDDDRDLPLDDEEEEQDLVTAAATIEVQPVSAKVQLDMAVRNVIEEIQTIDEQIKELAGRKLELQRGLRSSLEELQRTAGIELATNVTPTTPEPPVQTTHRPSPAQPQQDRKMSKVDTIILYVGDNREAKKTEISQYMRARDLAPEIDTELSRLIQKEVLANNRGVYSLGPKGAEAYRNLGGKKH